VEDESSMPRRQLSFRSLQALLDEVEESHSRVSSEIASVANNARRTLSRSHHSISELQHLIENVVAPDSPSVVPPSGMYSMTPVSSIRTAVLSASFRELLHESVKDEKPPIPRPPLFRRASSKENLVEALDDVLDTVEPSGERALGSFRGELVEVLDDVLDFL
jgi:hypothetical protein